jgi:hypothetical protein
MAAAWCGGGYTKLDCLAIAEVGRLQELDASDAVFARALFEVETVSAIGVATSAVAPETGALVAPHQWLFHSALHQILAGECHDALLLRVD